MFFSPLSFPSSQLVASSALTALGRTHHFLFLTPAEDRVPPSGAVLSRPAPQEALPAQGQSGGETHRPRALPHCRNLPQGAVLCAPLGLVGLSLVGLSLVGILGRS